MKLFEIDSTTRLVNLNKEWISTIKEFKKLITRDKGSEGDADGRRKLQAIREFTFIYHYCDYRSKFTNYSEKDKYYECLRNADLPGDLEIKKDEDLLNAIIRYKSLQEVPSLKVLSELKETLHSAHRVVQKLRSNLDVQLTKMDNMDLTLDTEEEDGKKKKDPITVLTGYLTAAMDIANRIPASIKAIEEQEEKVRKELGEENQVRGDAQIGIREERGAMSNKIKSPFANN
jgi:hypothetical protein